MFILITGAAGFVGSNLVKTFLGRGHSVIGVDNLSRGSLKNLEGSIQSNNFTLIVESLENVESIIDKIKLKHNELKIDEVWHLAANSDIPAGIVDHNVDLINTFLTTERTVQLCKAFKTKSIVFSSTSAIYGDLGDVPLKEDIGPLIPISNYGAMKLASEAYLYACSESWFESVTVFRFPNVIGLPATHGVIYDFIHKLKADPTILNVLGNGSQSKGYLHVSELIDAMLFIQNHKCDKVSIYNIGTDDQGATVKFIAEECVKQFSPNAKIIYGEENRGWVGDVPRFKYSIDKLRRLGWNPNLTSREAVVLAISEIIDQLK